MKKLFTMTAVLCLLLVSAWLGASWFIGLQTEKQVRRYFEQTAGQHELISYQRSLLHATAVTRLNVSQTPLGQWLDELPLQHDITHGPVFRQPVADTGWLLWQTRLERPALTADVLQQLDAAFATEQPLQVTAKVDFRQTAHYRLTLAPLLIESEADELSISLNSLQVEGEFVSGQAPENFDMTLSQLELANPGMKLILPELKIRRAVAEGAGNALSDAQPDVLTGLSWTADEVSAEFSSDAVPLRFKLSGRTTTHSADGQLAGNLSLMAEQFSGLSYPLQTLDFSLDYAGVKAAALTEINRLQNHMQDLQAQLGWQEDDVELPEGRRQLFQLNVQLREAADQLLSVLFQQALQAGQSTLKSRLTLQTANGRIAGMTDLSYAGSKHPVVLDDLMQARLPDWLAFLRGDIEWSMAQSALPSEWAFFLSYPVQQRGLVETDGEYRMKLRLLDNDAELNGRVVEYSELPERFLPPLAETQDDVPDDVWRIVEEQGFSDEVLRTLEQRDDVSPETLELFRQLQATTEALNKK